MAHPTVVFDIGILQRSNAIWAITVRLHSWFYVKTSTHCNSKRTSARYNFVSCANTSWLHQPNIVPTADSTSKGLKFLVASGATCHGYTGCQFAVVGRFEMLHRDYFKMCKLINSCFIKNSIVVYKLKVSAYFEKNDWKLQMTLRQLSTNFKKCLNQISNIQ